MSNTIDLSRCIPSSTVRSEIKPREQHNPLKFAQYFLHQFLNRNTNNKPCTYVKIHIYLDVKSI